MLAVFLTRPWWEENVPNDDILRYLEWQGTHALLFRMSLVRPKEFLTRSLVVSLTVPAIFLSLNLGPMTALALAWL